MGSRPDVLKTRERFDAFENLPSIVLIGQGSVSPPDGFQMPDGTLAFVLCPSVACSVGWSLGLHEGFESRVLFIEKGLDLSIIFIKPVSVSLLFSWCQVQIWQCRIDC